VDITRVGHLQALFNSLIAEMEIVILNLKGLFQVSQSTTEFFGSSENTGEIVISDSSVSVSFFCQHFSLAQEFKGNIKVFY
tara:strand:- start:303 stop:545 length:243 start_codon:yes stop_codon:yes gene_type:complete